MTARTWKSWSSSRSFWASCSESYVDKANKNGLNETTRHYCFERKACDVRLTSKRQSLKAARSREQCYAGHGCFFQGKQCGFHRKWCYGMTALRAGRKGAVSISGSPRELKLFLSGTNSTRVVISVVRTLMSCHFARIV